MSAFRGIGLPAPAADTDTGITQLTGDVTAGPGNGSQAATIAADAVTNAKLANMDANSIKGNNTGGSANPVDLTAAQATAMLSAVVGDSGSGGTKGLVPAPASGDAAAAKFLKADGTWAAPAGSASRLVQVVNHQTGAVLTGSTTIPIDDTIPQQSNEGNQLFTLSITPTNASNLLKITVNVVLAHTAATSVITTALFQGTTENAIAAVSQNMPTASNLFIATLIHYMTAGTTSSINFRVRSGSNSAGTLAMNGSTAGTRLMGGVMSSSITIEEILA